MRTGLAAHIRAEALRRIDQLSSLGGADVHNVKAAAGCAGDLHGQRDGGELGSRRSRLEKIARAGASGFKQL